MTAFIAMPESPAFARSQFGLRSNTQSFTSPLSGQTQTIERPGARWMASYSLPPMKRAQARHWQAFLLGLRGGAGHFYAFDPDAVAAQGTIASAALADTSRNELRNSEMLEAQLGDLSENGALPATWLQGPTAGLLREVVGLGQEDGYAYLDLRISGTPAAGATYCAFALEGLTQIAAQEGQTWSFALSHRLVAGSMDNASLRLRIDQIAANAVIQTAALSPVQSVSSTVTQRSVYTRTISDNVNDAVFVRANIYFAVTEAVPVDLTLRVMRPQLEQSATASVYIPTYGTARQRGGGVCLSTAADTAAQTGGRSITLWNLAPSTAAVLKTGDYISYQTAGGPMLHMVMQEASSDAYGCSVVQVEPPVRQVAVDNTPVQHFKAACAMGLVDNSVQWEADAQGVFRLSFSAEERF